MGRCAYAEGEAASNMLERRWFAALTAARALQSECDVLREVLDQAEKAWRHARGQLEKLENLRDLLAEDLSLLHGEENEISMGKADRLAKTPAA